MADAEFVQKCKDFLYLYGDEEWKEIIENSDDEYWMTFAPYIKMRIQTLGQFKDHCKYFFERITPTDELVIREKMKVTKEILVEHLPHIHGLLEHLTDEQWTEETIKDELISYIK